MMIPIIIPLSIKLYSKSNNQQDQTRLLFDIIDFCIGLSGALIIIASFGEKIVITPIKIASVLILIKIVFTVSILSTPA